MDKFGRNYVLEIQEQIGAATSASSKAQIASDQTTAISGATLSVTLPFTIEFDITRNVLSSSNVCQIRIYNLSEVNRNFIRHNEYDFGSYRAIRLKAGYGDNLATIFKGNVTSAWSVREGSNFITQIECFDGGFAFVNGVVNLNLPAGTDVRDAIQALAETLPHTDIGAIGGFFGAAARASSYSGNTMQILNDLTGGGIFIDSEKFNALRNNEFVETPGPPIVISSTSGLLGTPVLQQTLIKFDMLFEPLLQAGQVVILNSVTESSFNGTNIVKAVSHKGTISSAVCGSVITTGTFQFTQTPVGVPSI